MTRALLIASALLLAITLTSCKTYAPWWNVWVKNSVDLPGEIPLRVCTGGLTATIIVGTQVTLTATAGPGDWAFEEARPEGGWRAGDPLVLEATCTDEDGSEVGYARVEGRVGPPQYTTNPGSTAVYPPADSGGGPLYPTCLTPTVQRGQQPCIVERLMIPN